MINKAMLDIVNGVYDIASGAFKIFMELSNVDAIDSSKYEVLLKNIYVVIAVVLLFAMSFALLRGIVNPEDNKQGTSSVKKIVINLAISGVIMVFLPTVFTFAFDVQKSILSNNTIGKMFGYSSQNVETPSDDVEEKSYIELSGYSLTNGVYTAFLYKNCPEGEECDYTVDYKIDDTGTSYHEYDEIVNYVDRTGDFDAYSGFSDKIDNGIRFHFLVSLIAGLILLYVGVSFCFDMAVRLIKIVFYQVMAPFPIFLRVVPNTNFSKTFNSWLKGLLSCYFEVYLRIFAVYFMVFLAKTLIAGDVFHINSAFAKAFLILGLMVFIKQLPKLMSDITGIDSGKMNLNIREKLKSGGAFAAGAALGSGVTAMTRNAGTAISNSKSKFRDIKGTTGKERSKAIRSFAGSVLGGLGSTVGGSVSGTVRGARAGTKAGSVKEMQSAAGAGAKATVDSGNARRAYKASHPNVVSGKFNDALSSIGRWAGVNNIQALQEQNASIDLVSGKVDKVVDSAKDMIKSQLLKKSKNFGFGVSGSDTKYGIKFDADTYRKLSDLLDRASTNQGPQSLAGIVSDEIIQKHREETLQNEGVARDTFTADEIQRIFGKYENDFAKEVANTAFRSENSFNKYVYETNDNGEYVLDASGNRKRRISYDEEAAFASIRSAAEDARNELKRNIGSDLIKKANEISAEAYREAHPEDPALKNFVSLNERNIDDSDLQVTNDTTIDKLGTAAKIIKNKNAEEISKIKQKEESSKK